MVAPPAEPRFYMTYARARPTTLIPWAEEHQVPILENALHRWSDARETFLHMWEYDTPHVIDAGGYNVMSRFVTRNGELDDVSPKAVQLEVESEAPFYPWTMEEYHGWLCEYDDEFEWASVMDYTTGPQFDVLWSAEDRIERTFEHTITQFELASGADYDLLPVLQGRTVEEYVDFYGRLEDHGIPTDYVGLGSIQVKSDQVEVVDIEREVRERIDVDAMHGFGIKADAYRNGSEFETADSQAWAYHPSNGRVILDADGTLRRIDGVDDAFLRTVFSFKSYYSHVTRIRDGEPAVDLEYEIDDSASDADALAVLNAHT